MARLGPPTSQRQSPQPRWPPWPNAFARPPLAPPAAGAKDALISAYHFWARPLPAPFRRIDPAGPGYGSPLRRGPTLGCRPAVRAAKRLATCTRGTVQGMPQPGPVPAPPPPAAVRAHHGHPAITHSRAVLREMHARCRGGSGRGLHTLGCHRRHGGLPDRSPGLVKLSFGHLALGRARRASAQVTPAARHLSEPL
jgi:hypothetical protein